MILLASNSQDFPTLQPVIDELKRRKADVLVYLADKVASGEVTMSCYVDEHGQYTITYGDRVFSPADVGAAWMRRAETFLSGELDSVKSIYFDKQRRDSQAALWYAIPEDRWLNAPARMHTTANNKHYQMQLAHQAGFLIPQTATSNSWEQIFDTIKSEEIILKMPYGVFYNEQKESRFLATTIVKRSEYSNLKGTSPFPGIWQEYIPKKREWRVTVVGKNVFSVAIYTTDEARDDWRKKQFEKEAVRFVAEPLSHAVEQKCVRMLQKMGLRYGAFDIVEKPDETFVFLEVNLNGQYQWAVDELGLPISSAVASELLTIASSTTH